MKAVVLTCDRYMKLTDHMITKYETLWPESPFEFRVPYQKYPIFLKEKYGDKIELVRTESDIISTMKTLLSDLDDEEWIYWCVDDKYPIELQKQQIYEIHDWIVSLIEPELSGVIFCRVRNLLRNKYLFSNREVIFDSVGHKYLQRRDYSQIWIHQFLKVKVLRHLFNNFSPKFSTAKEMDYLKEKVKLPKNQKLYVSESSLAVFGESTSRGKLTSNCAKSFHELGWQLPDNFEVSNETIIMKP